MLITDAVHIWRESDGDYLIEWQASHPDTEVTVEPLVEGAVVAPSAGSVCRVHLISGISAATALPMVARSSGATCFARASYPISANRTWNCWAA
jgi:hypothetical protein